MQRENIAYESFYSQTLGTKGEIRIASFVDTILTRDGNESQSGIWMRRIVLFEGGSTLKVTVGARSKPKGEDMGEAAIESSTPVIPLFAPVRRGAFSLSPILMITLLY